MNNNGCQSCGYDGPNNFEYIETQFGNIDYSGNYCKTCNTKQDPDQNAFIKKIKKLNQLKNKKIKNHS